MGRVRGRFLEDILGVKVPTRLGLHPEKTTPLVNGSVQKSVLFRSGGDRDSGDLDFLGSHNRREVRSEERRPRLVTSPPPSVLLRGPFSALCSVLPTLPLRLSPRRSPTVVVVVY